MDINYINIVFYASLLAVVGYKVFFSLRKKTSRLLDTETALILIVGTVGTLIITSQHTEVMNSMPARQGFFIFLLYLATLTGIFFNYIFFNGGEFKLSKALKPTLISPIVFIPILNIYQDNIIGYDHFSVESLTIILMAFQNGFFWEAVSNRPN